MVAEYDPPVGRHEVAAIFVEYGRGFSVGIEREDLRGDELTIEAIADEVGTDGRCQQPRSADRFASRESQIGKGAGAGDRDEDPEEGGEDSVHGGESTVRVSRCHEVGCHPSLRSG
jgi:hypothetical protein